MGIGRLQQNHSQLLPAIPAATNNDANGLDGFICLSIREHEHWWLVFIL